MNVRFGGCACAPRAYLGATPTAVGILGTHPNQGIARRVAARTLCDCARTLCFAPGIEGRPKAV